MWLQKLKSLSVLYFFVDLITVFCVWLVSYWLRFEALIPIKDVPSFNFHFKLAPFVMVITLAVLFFERLYHPDVLFKLKKSFHLYTFGMILAVALIVTLTYLYNQLNYSRGVLLIYLIGGNLGLISVRALLRTIFLHRFQKFRFIRRAFLVGSNKASTEAVLKRISESPELGLEVVGYFSKVNFGIDRVPYKGWNLKAQYCANENVRAILFCPNWDEISEIEGVIKDLSKHLYDLHMILDISFLHYFNYSIDEFAARPMLNLNDHAIQGLNFIIKRAFDIGFTLVVLLLGFPLFSLIAVLVKLTSQGPVFYYQKRVGFDGKEFWMPKFRTMIEDSENITGPVWATKNDPRVTRIGRILRKTSLDELPQFLSVLRGYMSVVGPRPERPEFVPVFSEKIPAYNLRNKVKAGITGWAQINGLRGNTPLDSRLEYDLHYIKNWSLLFDLRIIVGTFVRGLVNKNAY